MPEDGLVAAAARYTARLFGSRVAKPDDSWQSTAWALWRDTPEVRFGGTWVGNMMGMARFFAGKRMPDGSVVPLPPDHPASIKVAEMAGGPSGQAELLTEHGPNLFTVGEDWTVIEQTREGERWHVLSTQEARRQGSSLQVEIDGKPRQIPMGDDDPSLIEPDAPLAIRTWQPFPGRKIEADSSVRSSFALLEELRLLNAAVAAIAKSRLTGRGIVFMPQGTSFPTTAGAAPSTDLIGKLIEIAGTAYSQPDSAAATVPIFLEVPRESTNAPMHMEFDSAFDTLAVTLREEAIRRFAAGCDFPAEIMLGQGDANHWCASDDTRAMTRDGWRSVDELAIGTDILTLNHETGLAEWAPVEDMYTATVEDLPMVSMEMQGHSSLTTPNHRWPTMYTSRSIGVVDSRDWRTSSTLRNRDRLVSGAPCVDQPVDPKYRDDIVELVAWYWTEGHNQAAGGVNITQSHTVNGPRVDRIRRVLTRLYGPAVTEMRNLGRPAWREDQRTSASSYGGPVTSFSLNKDASVVLREIAPGKAKLVDVRFITELTPAQLELFIDVSLQGDGWHYRQGVSDIFQKDPRALDAIEAAGILAGYSISRTPAQGGECLHLSHRSTVNPKNSANEAARRVRNGIKVGERRDASVTIAEYTGRIWCPVTRNGTWLAGRNGSAYYTGNSVWAMDESAVRLAILPRLRLICQGYTSQWLRPTLEVMQVKDAAECIVWYDASDLRPRTNRSQTAIELFGLGQINGDALRRETNFDDADKPTKEQEDRSILVGIVRDAPSTAPIILPLLGIQVPGLAEAIAEAPIVDGGTSVEPTPLPVAEDPGVPRASDGLMAAADALVNRAMDLAGQRMRNGVPRSRRGALEGIEASAIHISEPVTDEAIVQHKLLNKAWDRAPEIAARYDVDPTDFVACLDRYTRDCLVNGVEHAWDQVPALLSPLFPEPVPVVAEAS